MPVILVTRLNGAAFALNPDLVERADATPDTVVTLLDGTKYIIAESLPDFINLVRDHRASIIALAQRMEITPAPPGDDADDSPSAARQPAGKVVQLHRRER